MLLTSTAAEEEAFKFMENWIETLLFITIKFQYEYTFQLK
jgi:hypothetical protein